MRGQKGRGGGVESWREPGWHEAGGVRRAGPGGSWELLEGSFCQGQRGPSGSFGAGEGQDQPGQCVMGFAGWCPLGATIAPPPRAPQGPTHQWHQLPLLHDFRQHLAPGRARADLGPQEVPGGEVGVAVLLDNLLTLGALPRAGPACKRPPHSEAPRNRAPAGTGSARGHPAKWGQSPGCSPRAQAPPHPRACPVCCRARLPWTHPPQR